MRINQIKWATCPRCFTLINGWQFYPASVAMEKGYPDVGFMVKCLKCENNFIVYSKVTIELTTEKTTE